MTDYREPRFKQTAFHCPFCRVYTRQDWKALALIAGKTSYSQNRYMGAGCEHCKQMSIWLEGQMVHPIATSAPPANRDLPSDVSTDYQEAAMIVELSPRGAGALLRLAIQKLCKHLGQPGENINDDIKALVAAGLPPKVQQALDAVRVIGNHCVHPGELDVRDDPETVQKLFRLVNFIAQSLITDPKEIDDIYGTLPATTREAIERRDAKPE